MLKTGQDQNDGKQDWRKTDARVLGQILAAQNILFVLPDTTRIAGFFAQALVSVPGVTSCRVCLGDISVQVGLDSDVCRECEALRKEAGETLAMPFGFKCGLADQHDIRIIIITLETSEHTYGFFVFRTDTTGVFESYKPFINNLSNYIALSLENRLQKNLLQKAYDGLESRVEERTKELKKVNEQLEEDISERKRTENALIESEAHYRGLFEHSPVSLWEEDFSDVKRHIDELRASGVSDLRAYFEEHPEEVDLFVSATKIISVNQATLQLFKADSKERLLEGLNVIFSKESLDIFKEELITFAGGDTQSQSEAVLTNLADDKLYTVVRFSIAPGHTNTWGKVFVSVSDITKRKQAEEKLRQSERISTIMARIATVFLTVPDEEVYAEVLRVVLEVMESRFGIFGFIADNGDLVIPSMTREVWSKCQVPEKSIVFPPHTWGGSLWGRAIREKKTLYSNDPFHTPEGHIPIFNFLAAPVGFQDKTIGLLAVGNKEGGYTAEDKELQESITHNFSSILNARLQRDLQERQRATAEEELRRACAYNRSLIEASLDPLVTIGSDGKITDVNAATEAATGYSRSKLIGTDFCDYFTEPRNAEEGYQQVFKDGLVRDYELELRHRDGHVTPVIYNAAVFRSEAGEVAGIFAAARDITERKRTEESLKLSEKFVEDILASVDEAFVVIDREYRILMANRAYCEQTGKPLENIIGRHCYEVSHHADRPCHDPGHVCGSKRTFETGEPSFTVHTHTDDKGKQYHVEIRTYAMKDASGEIQSVIEVINDITEKTALENQLRHAQKMEAIGTLAGGIAHDFNNILNVITGYGSMVMDRLGDDPLSKEQLNEVLAAADRAANLTKRLLTFSRKQVVEVKPVNVNEIIFGMEKMLSRIISEDIAFTMELTSRKMIVMADAGQIEQVLMNLVTNASYAMPKGGRLTISTGTREMDDAYITAYGYGKAGTYALISVADTGSGMDAETQKKIFEPFFTTKGIGEGTGLGLSIVYGIIEQYNGYINVYSEPGKGTIFKIYLPLIEEEIAKGKEVEAVAPIKGGTETILIAEDDASLRNMSRIVLESSGYNVITAENGEEAITKYMENRDKIQLVILDMLMPKKNGKEAYEGIRKINPDIKALFASGYTLDLITKKDMLEEGIDLIFKPVTPKDLLKKVREALDR